MKFVLDTPVIYLITKGEATAENFAEKRKEILERFRVAVESRVSLVQLREKQLPARLVYELAVDAAAITRGTKTRLLVNDRADIAAASGADGVQLTSRSLSTAVVRKAFGSEMIVGVSTHSMNEIKEAAAEGADFAVFGPVFETPGKSEPKCLSTLREACEAVGPFPVIGIGGIDGEKFESVLDAGASGIAAIRWLNESGSLTR